MELRHTPVELHHTMYFSMHGRSCLFVFPTLPTLVRAGAQPEKFRLAKLLRDLRCTDSIFLF
jgi:hypothetical protein